MNEKIALKQLQPEHAEAIKQMIDKRIDSVSDKKIDDKFKGVNEQISGLKVEMGKIATGVISLNKAILGDEDDKRWGRKSFIERFTLLESKVEYSFKQINEANFDELKKITAYVKQLQQENTLESVKAWQDRDSAMDMLNKKIGARNFAQYISLGISLITLITLILNIVD